MSRFFIPWPIRKQALSLAALCVLCCAPLSAAPPLSATEESVKAAFVYNFVKFADWPEAALPADEKAIRLCTDAVGKLRVAIEALSGKKAKNRSLQIRELPSEGFAGCHVALIESEDNLDRLDGDHATLTIHSEPAKYGILYLFREKRRLRFNVNLVAAQRARIQLSSTLLGVAAKVQKTTTEDTE